MLDFRLLVDWGVDTVNDHGGAFRTPAELQRPSLLDYSPIEKNWFVFWDVAGNSYVHYDIAPARAFAQLNPDGSVGPDLAPLAAYKDNSCLARLLPSLPDPTQLKGDDSESIHQATNALTITLCARADSSCVPSPDNTFVLTIIQHKRFYNFHSTYEPYALLFRAVPPFDVYGISQKPLWISGRKPPPSSTYDAVNEDRIRAAGWESEMMYVTSISWKAQGLGYHGFVDDVLFVGFGIEDAATGGIDIVAGDLIDGLDLCS
ncbi:hypothetical protein BJX64DRAFT_258629 [Aspergillus heterothallicus]